MVSIIALVAVRALPAFAKERKTSLTQKCIQNMRAVYGACSRYEMDNNKTLYNIRSDGVAIRNLLMTDGYMNPQNNFDCPSSSLKDYDDYRLVYQNGQDLVSVSCTILPGVHILP